MKGNVDSYDPSRGFGFLKGIMEGKERMYFAHNSDIRFDLPDGVGLDIPFLLPGWEVEFTPIQRKDWRWKAVDVEPLEHTGFTVNPLKERPTISREGNIVVSVAEDGSMRILGKKVDPVIDATPHFRMYYMGRGTIRGFAVKLPTPTAEKVFLLVNPKEQGKTIRRVTPDGLYKNVSRGSFVMEVRRDGHVLVQKIGAHMYGMDENWLVLTTRFEHKYDFTKDLVDQTPKSAAASDKDANQEFVHAIMRGIELLGATAPPPLNRASRG